MGGGLELPGGVKFFKKIFKVQAGIFGNKKNVI